MGDAIDRALSENHALISAILDHYSAGRSVPAVALLERLQINLEFIAAVAEHGIPLAPPLSAAMPGSASAGASAAANSAMAAAAAQGTPIVAGEGRTAGERLRERDTTIAPKPGEKEGDGGGANVR